MAKQNQSAQANNKAQIQLKAADKATLTIPTSQHLEQATKSADGAITIKQSMGALKLVDVADVDLLLTFANGEHVVIPHGAIDAVGKNPPDALFSDSKISLPELFKLVGVTNPAKAGSLRLVSENIDANPPTDENVSHDEHIPDTPPPPAPMLKVGAGQGAGKSLGTGLGSVPETYTPLVTAQPSVYRVGKSSAATLSDIIKGTPNFDAALFTSNEFKVTPAVTDNIPGIPQGAYQSSLSALQLASRTSPEYQSTREVINVVGTDIVNHNTSFVADSNQWAKTLHAAINNFSTIDSITFTINVGGAAELAAANANLNLVGAGIDATSPFSWTMTPPADPSAGFDIQMLYDLNTNVTANFVLNVNVKGTSGPVTLNYTKQLYFTYRDVDANQTDFTVTDPSTGNQMMVLPSAGLGIEFRGDSANNEIHAGAGNDWIFGNAGDDILYGDTGDDILYGGLGGDELYGGVGSDTASYRYAAATSGTTGVVASLSTPANNTGEAGGDSYRDNSIENLIGSTYNDTLEGNAAKNTLSGLAGDDTLIGVGFGNILDGGGYEIDGTRIQNDGNDTVSYVGTSSTINIDASLSRGTGYNTAQPSIKDEYTNIENLTGGDGNDTLEGNSFGNVLDGRAGNDTVTFANASATDTQTATGVFATLMQDSNQAYLNLTQGTGAAAGDTYMNIENLTGSAFNDTLEGNNDTSGNKLDGGTSGNDTVTFVNAGAGVFASLTNNIKIHSDHGNPQDAAYADTYISIENLTGSAFNDTLEGNASANKFDGGAGEDTISYENSLTSGGTIGVYASLIASASNTGFASGDTYQNIENLTGSAFNDTLEGKAGANKFDGGLGNNTVTYTHSNAGVTASLVNSTINLGDALGDTYTNIQNLTGSEFDDFLYGDANINIINGGAGKDTIQGNGGGNINIGGDILDGGSDVDTLVWAQWATNYGIAFDMFTGQFTIQNVLYSKAYNFENFTNNASLISDVTLTNADNIYTGSTLAGKDTAIYTYANNSVQANIGTSSWSNGSITLQGQKATGGSGNDTLINIDNLYGSNYSDTLIGNGDNNIFQGYAGADLIDGLGGTDTATYNDSNAAVTITFSNSNTATGSGGHAAGDILNNIEQVIGSKNYGDTFILNSTALPTYIDGNGGADTIQLTGLSAATYTTLFHNVAILSANNEGLNIKDGYSSIINISYQDVQLFVDQGASSVLQITANNGDVINLTGGATFFDNDTNGLTSLTQTQANGTYYISNGSSTVATINWQHS